MGRFFLSLMFFLGALPLVSCASNRGGEAPLIEAASQDAYESDSRVDGVLSEEQMQLDLEAAAGSRVFFTYDAYTLSTEARANLLRQAEWLRRNNDALVIIAGNCDERGTREYNLALGARRAQASKDFLVANGVAARRIRTVSYGKERPVDPRSTPAAWARNRNTETKIVNVSS